MYCSSPIRRKFKECSIINPALSLLKKHLVIGRRQKAMYCMARQCSPLTRIFMEFSIISPALSLLKKHLIIGQRQKAPKFSAFHWSPHDSLVSIGQHFVTTRVPKRTESSLSTESDRSGPNRLIGPGSASRA